MPYPTLSMARDALDNNPILTPNERSRRERELRSLRTDAVKGFRKQLNDALGSASSGYEAVNKEQKDLYREFKDLLAQEGRMSASEYQKQLEALRDRQQQLEAARDRHRTALVRTNDRVDFLEESPDDYIDDFYRRFPALPHPAQKLIW